VPCPSRPDVGLLHPTRCRLTVSTILAMLSSKEISNLHYLSILKWPNHFLSHLENNFYLSSDWISFMVRIYIRHHFHFSLSSLTAVFDILNYFYYHFEAPDNCLINVGPNRFKYIITDDFNYCQGLLDSKRLAIVGMDA
jgi:hypothetical protein